MRIINARYKDCFACPNRFWRLFKTSKATLSAVRLEARLFVSSLFTRQFLPGYFRSPLAGLRS